ncbi:hypothetical protein C8Q78DRAFT_1071232 [Trametes maxima]|nr:hypothetical protein C8Q78DRAFT_1071232 [Trametes maxima]
MASYRDNWPAPNAQMSAARAFLIECAASDSPTLILPDKDADGLTSGLIVHLTLLHLGLAPSRLSTHFPAKGATIHAPHEAATDARYIIATDQGSRGGPPLLGVSSATTKTLVIDHHWSTAFPEGAVVCSAARSPPVATSSTLAYELCLPLLENKPNKEDEALRERLAYLCAIGTMGDLGTGFKWEPPFPDMRTCFKKWTKVLGEAVALLNAPRRTPEYDVPTAWRALLSSPSPRALVDASSSNLHVCRLFAARASVKSEVARCSRNAPVFSGDGRVALVRISSAAQVHPLIATRWASSLKGARLAIVMCANSGYLPGMTNFACRVARAGGGNLGAKRKAGGDEEGGTDIIETLKEYAGRIPGLTEAMGDDFARGHKQASGGIVRTEDFERLWDVMSSADHGNGESAAKRRRGLRLR